MRKIAIVQIGVPDMSRALEFYDRLLGFEVDSKDAAPHFVTLKQDGVTLLLAKVEQPAVPGAYPTRAQVVLNVATKDLRSELARLKEAGADLVHEAPQPFPLGAYAAVRDPGGNVLELVEFGGST